MYVSSVLKMPKTKKAYVIGMAGLEEELRSEGIAFLGGTVLVASSPARLLLIPGTGSGRQHAGIV